MIPAIILSFGMMVFPESPRWLIDHGKEAEALEILADLHGGGDQSNEFVVFEYEEIKQQVWLLHRALYIQFITPYYSN